MRPTDGINVPARVIADAAQALWGPSWQTPMAQALGLNLRRVQRIAAAARDDEPYLLPRTLLEEILAAIERQRRPLQRAYDVLRGFLDGA